MEIKKRRGRKRTVIIIAGMMLVSIYHMNLTGETFNPSDDKLFKNSKPKPLNLTEELAVEFLKKQVMISLN